MAARNYVYTSAYLAPYQLKLLRQLSAETGVSAQAFIRQGVNEMLHRCHKITRTVDDEYLFQRIQGTKYNPRAPR